VRRGASWTAAYHLQLTVAAVARPVHSSVMPSSSVLLRGPGLLLAQTASARRSRQRTSSVRRRRRGRRCQDAAVTSLTGIRQACPPSRFVVRDPAVQPAGVPPSGVRSPGVRRPGPAIRTGAGQPSGVHPVCCPPLRCPPLRCPPRLLSSRPVSSRLLSTLSVRSRPSPPTSGGGVRTRSRRPGDPAPQQRVEVAVAAAPSGGRVDGRGALYPTPPRSRGGQSGVGGGPGPGLWAAAAAARVGCATRHARPARGAPMAGGDAVAGEQASA
jgi:hypothetical protein